MHDIIFFSSHFFSSCVQNVFQDLEFFVSPGMRSYDAIGLMRQMNEHTASAFANAREILTSEDLEMPSETKVGNNQSSSPETNDFPHNEQENKVPGALVSFHFLTIYVYLLVSLDSVAIKYRAA